MSSVISPALSDSQMSQRKRGRGWLKWRAVKSGSAPKIASVIAPRVIRWTRTQRRPLNHGRTLRLVSEVSAAARMAMTTKSADIRK